MQVTYHNLQAIFQHAHHAKGGSGTGLLANGVCCHTLFHKKRPVYLRVGLLGQLAGWEHLIRTCLKDSSETGHILVRTVLRCPQVEL